MKEQQKEFLRRCSFIITKDMTQSIPVAPQSFDDIMVEAIDFFHIIEFF